MTMAKVILFRAIAFYKMSAALISSFVENILRPWSKYVMRGSKHETLSHVCSLSQKVEAKGHAFV